MGPLRVGLIGAGLIARAHARGLAALPAERARLSAVLGRRPERAQELARQHNAQAARDLGGLLPQVDAVVICTPTPSHAGYALAAIEAGKHVLCEKPLARTVIDAERMVQAAAVAGVKLMPGHVTRYEVDHRKAREVLLRGDLGDLQMASHSITGPLPDWAGDNWFADPKQSGGVLLDLALHSFDFLLWLYGEPVRRVYTLGDSAGTESYALVSLRFASGGLATVEASWAHPRSTPSMLRAELIGSMGRLHWDYAGIAALHSVSDGGKGGKQAHVMPGEDSFVTQMEAFIRCIEEDTPPPISGADGVEAVRVALAAAQSLKARRPIEL